MPSSKITCCKRFGSCLCDCIGTGNVRTAFLWNVISAAGSSITAGSVFIAPYIYYIEGGSSIGDQEVGLIAATAGLTMIFLALPVGYLTDMYPRALILKVSGIVGLLSCITLFFSLYIQDSNHNLGLGLLFANAILVGAYNAISGPALSSILADSVQTGARTSIYALQYAAQIGAGSAGPLIGIFFLIYLGNEWSTRNLQYVIYAGNVIVAFSCFFAFFFDDKKSLGEESEGILSPSVTREEVSTTITTSSTGTNSNSNSKSNQIDTFLVNDRNENDSKFSKIQQQAVQSSSINHDENDGLNEPFLSPVSTSSSKTKSKSKSVRIVTKDETMEEEEEEDESNDGSIKVIKKTSSSRNLGHQTVNLGCCLLRVKHIPYLIFTSDFTIAIGAGMTVQYFSLFFANAEGLSPIAVASIWVACPLLIALTTAGVVPLAKIIGRAQAAVLCDAIGSACIFALWYDKTPVWCTIAIYLVRTAAMNSSYPIQRAILMDVIPKKDRGKWNSVENLTSFTWTGSAAAGGYLVSHFGYRFTFLITGGLYILATMILSLLIALTYGEVTDVKEEEEEEEEEKEGEGEEVEE
jgi:MFS family permease